MKKLYIQPATMSQTMNFVGSICIGSFHGDAGLEYGGDAGQSSTPIDPM